MELKITLQQLEQLLDDQKRLVIERLSGHTYTYNKESSEGHFKDLPIDKDKFFEVGMKANYPNDIDVLKRYVK